VIDSTSSGKSLGRGLVPLSERLRHPKAQLSGQRAPSNSVIYLAHAKYLLLESERLDGTRVGTPMWFAVMDDTILLRTEAESPKVRRIRRRPIVKIAACTMRGFPVGDYIECFARIVPQEREAQAEMALYRSYGFVRRLFSTFARNDYAYLELTPFDPEKTPVLRGEALVLGDRAAHEDRQELDKTPPNAA
jgi:uncharacterized protein